MKNEFISIAIATVLVFSSCSTTSKTADNSKQNHPAETAAIAEQQIPYTIAERYFIVNTYNDGDLTNPKIDSREAFDKLFKPARVMGENGKPTVIDFSTQYVLAIIGKTTNSRPTITVTSLKQKESKILLNYKITEAEKPSSPVSATIRPVLLLIVDKKHQGEVIMSE